MRKISIEMNLGKKSRARFPRRILNNLKLKLTAPAAEAEPLPPLGPALTLFGVNARGFCEEFNHYSKKYDSGFPVSINLWVTPSKSYFYDFRSPSCFNLFHRCFNFTEGTELPARKKILLLACLNFGLIKMVGCDLFFKNTLVCVVKQIFGSLRSYGFRLKSSPKTNILIPSYKIRNEVYNTKFTLKKISRKK